MNTSNTLLDLMKLLLQRSKAYLVSFVHAFCFLSAFVLMGSKVRDLKHLGRAERLAHWSEFFLPVG